MSAGHAPRKKVAELKVLTKSFSTNPGRASNFDYSQRTVSSKMRENLMIEICDYFFVTISDHQIQGMCSELHIWTLVLTRKIQSAPPLRSSS